MKKSRLLGAVCALLFTLFIASSHATSVLYATGSIGGSMLFTVNNTSGVASGIGFTGSDTYLFAGGLAYSDTSNTLYATGYDRSTPGAFGAYTPGLFEINTLTGAAILIGHTDPSNIGLMANGGGGLAWDSNSNTLFATGCNYRFEPGVQYCDSALFSLNTSTGVASLVGLNETGNLHGGGLAYDSANNILYATGEHPSVNNSGLYSIDPSSGVATFIGQTMVGYGLAYGGLEYDPISRTLYATGRNALDANNSMLYEIDSLTGNTTVVGLTGTGGGLNSGGLAIGPSAIPIPPSVWLFGSGLLWLIGIARRKKAA